MRDIRHRTEGARNKAQVARDQRLLEQHDVQAFALDFGTQAIFDIAALQDGIGSFGIPRKRAAGRTDVRNGLFAQARQVAFQVFQLLDVLAPGLH